MKLKCIVGHPKQAFVPLHGCLVVLHLPGALESMIVASLLF